MNVKSRVTEFSVPHDVNHSSVERILDLFTTEKMIGAGTIILASNNFMSDVLMYQACLALGIHYSHTIPLQYSLRAEITSRMLTFEEMNAAVERTPVTDPLFKHPAHNLCHRRPIGDLAPFQDLLDCKSRAASRNLMAEIDEESTGRGVGRMRGDRLPRPM